MTRYLITARKGKKVHKKSIWAKTVSSARASHEGRKFYHDYPYETGWNKKIKVTKRY